LVDTPSQKPMRFSSSNCTKMHLWLAPLVGSLERSTDPVAGLVEVQVKPLFSFNEVLLCAAFYLYSPKSFIETSLRPRFGLGSKSRLNLWLLANIVVVRLLALSRPCAKALAKLDLTHCCDIKYC